MHKKSMYKKQGTLNNQIVSCLVCVLLLAISTCTLAINSSEKNSNTDDFREKMLAVEALPYVYPLSGDPLFWELLCSQKDPKFYIGLLGDKTKNSNDRYDLSYIVFTMLLHLVPDIFDRQVILTLSDQKHSFFEEYIRTEDDAFKQLQAYFISWYEKNGDDLVWVIDEQDYAQSGRPDLMTYLSDSKKPIGGCYRLKSNREDTRCLRL